MANNCINYLSLSMISIVNFVEIKKAIEQNSLLAYLLPYPDNIDPHSDEGYNYRCKCWGNSCDIYDSEIITEYKSDLTYHLEVIFYTKWKPAYNVFENLDKIRYNFSLEFVETGMGFGGLITDSNGTLEFNLDEQKIDVVLEVLPHFESLLKDYYSIKE